MKSLLAACLLAFLAGCSLGEGEAEAVDIEPFLKLLPEELARAPSTVEDSKNALPFLLEAVDSYVEPDAATEDWMWDLLGEDGHFPSGLSGQAIERWLRRNEDVIEAMTEMVKREKLRFPAGFLKEKPGRRILPEGIPFDIGEDRTGFMILLHMKRLAYLELAFAKHRHRQGDEEGTVDSLLRVLRLGDLIADSESPFIAYLVGSAIGSIGRNEVRWFLAQPDCSERALLRLLETVGVQSERAAAANSLRAELRHFILPALVTLPESPPREVAQGLVHGNWPGEGDAEKTITDAITEIISGHPRPYDREQTIRLLGQKFSRVLERVRGPWKSQDVETKEGVADVLEVWPEELVWGGGAYPPEVPLVSPETIEKARASLRALENPMGKLLLDNVFRSLIDLPHTGEKRNAWMRIFDPEADRQATICLIALRIHQMRKGALPESLDDLVSAGILRSVPSDPYRDGPLSWSRERKLVWTVGPEGKEDVQALLDAEEARGRWVWEVR